MKIAYLFHRDAADPGVQSGRPAAILDELRRQGVAIEPVFPLAARRSRKWWLKKVQHRLLGRHYRWDREPEFLASYATEFQTRTRGKGIDLVFSPGSESVSQLQTHLPITFCADATFANLVDYYGDFTGVAEEYLWQGHAQEAAALSKAKLAVYPSEWAARSATEFYGADPQRIAVIPFGANLGGHNTRAEVWSWIEERPRDCLRLLFVGREWQRKGGEIVIAAARHLLTLGQRVELEVVGCAVPARYRGLPWLRCHGLLESGVPDQVERLRRLYRRAHFVFVPSRAEAYGITFAEGNAFGLPVVATATGGITSIVRDGWNGLLCGPEAGAPEYAAAIAAAFADPGRYRQLCRQAFGEFDQRLNWRVFCQRYRERAAEAIALKPGVRSNRAARRWAPPLRVAFLASEFLNPWSPVAWSGLPFFSRRALEDAGVATEVIWVEDRHRVATWLNFSYWRLLRGRRYLRFCSERLLQGYARQIERRLAEGPRVDAVFSVSTWPLAYLRTRLPAVLYTDACFGALLGFYNSFSNLAAPSIRSGHRAERLALQRCNRVVYSTEWAAKAAQAYYDLDPSRVNVVPFGANFQDPPAARGVAEVIRRRDLARCELLLVGVDWERKGVETAVQATQELRARGCAARLTVVGCQAPRGRVLPAGVEVLPFVRKETSEGRDQLRRLYERSHFFILPSRAEASPIVFSEACVFGLPCLAADVGGVSSIVIDGVNGRVHGRNAEGKDYADTVLALLDDPEAYRKLARGARQEADTRLSWDVAGTKLAVILADVVASARSRLFAPPWHAERGGRPAPEEAVKT